MGVDCSWCILLLQPTPQRKSEFSIEVEGHTLNNNKDNKKSKRLKLQERIGLCRIGLYRTNYFILKQRRADLIKTFKIINGISNYDRYFSMFLLELEIYYEDRFQNVF